MFEDITRRKKKTKKKESSSVDSLRLEFVSPIARFRSVSSKKNQETEGMIDPSFSIKINPFHPFPSNSNPTVNSRPREGDPAILISLDLSLSLPFSIQQPKNKMKEGRRKIDSRSMLFIPLLHLSHRILLSRNGRIS